MFFCIVSVPLFILKPISFSLYIQSRLFSTGSYIVTYYIELRCHDSLTLDTLTFKYILIYCNTATKIAKKFVFNEDLRVQNTINDDLWAHHIYQQCPLIYFRWRYVFWSHLQRWPVGINSPTITTCWQ